MEVAVRCEFWLDYGVGEPGEDKSCDPHHGAAERGRYLHGYLKSHHGLINPLINPLQSDHPCRPDNNPRNAALRET